MSDKEVVIEERINLSDKYSHEEVMQNLEKAKRFISSLQLAEANRHIYQSLINGIACQDKYVVDACMEYTEVFKLGTEILEQSRFFG